jgi:hypothetical protein
MFPLSLLKVQLIIAGILFLLGFLSILLGVFILLTRGYSSEIQTIASHTARMGQKGIAEEVSGLVESASGLIEAINQLVRTASGVGAFLIMLGILMISATYWIVSKMDLTAL